jgi:hypothetical protein
MSEKVTARDWLSVTGAQITETPDRVLAECLRPSEVTPNGRLRPSISFDPADPESVNRAKEAAIKQIVPPRMCGEWCPLPCTLRRLEDSSVDYLMSVFGINNTGSN